MADWNAVVAIVALGNLLITVAGGLIAFGSLKTEIRFNNVLLEKFERTISQDIARHEKAIDDMRRGKAWIIDDDARSVNREYGR